ncbi:hypothetical protein M413DRAFT_348368 [Hebeloma cylindrosporum]|uniref:Uncharacterized protein n=1 Tax=Hebeloma cylindrosporum TaxID=76867 RepID=A0A0C3BVT8_HEBCY|nr:hypothetical protein M413DRAFT_348368 [Hebeloma cylindrosporum h7]
MSSLLETLTLINDLYYVFLSNQNLPCWRRGTQIPVPHSTLLRSSMSSNSGRKCTYNLPRSPYPGVKRGRSEFRNLSGGDMVNVVKDGEVTWRCHKCIILQFSRSS